ncbi:MAG TPA: transglycosylase domain-containing protein, partial [Candidatus Gracilibacteria bacterium]|nr:transglycosylase domain-containing protein [Candidatus Gracilibacteria bacterium]
QVVRNLLGIQRNRNLSDKMLEAMYAVRISNVYTKDQILELYLNRIYYGNLSYGAESAALDYFGKHVRDLDLAQASFLAGLPQSPSRYNPFVSFEEAKKRQRYVLERMDVHDFITAEERDAAYGEALQLKPKKHGIKAPHFVHYILNELEESFGPEAVIRGGLNVYTTLDYDLQLVAEDTIDRHVTELAKNHVGSGALVSMDVKTGQVLAWVGSADYFNEEIDGAVDIVTSLRQPGSSIKPLNYLAAFEKGYTPATVIFDIPTQFTTQTGPYTPKNYDLDYHGPVRIRTALASSYNIPAVKTLEYVGVPNFINFLSTFGVDTLKEPAEHYGLALTLGGGEVRLIDMAQAFNVIANYGMRLEPATLLKVTDKDGVAVSETKPPSGKYILGPQGREHAYQIIDILKDPDARIPGFGEGSVLEISREAAVKTGTTRNFRDNWTIGFTPDLLTAVWVGNADATPMENISGIDGAAPIWADFMEAALKSVPDSTFEIPSNLREVEICALSGMLPTELCTERFYEWFVAGSEPKEPDNYYRMMTINTATGRIIDERCQKSYSSSLLEQKVLVAYPPELQKWATQKGLGLAQIEPCIPPLDYASGSSNGYTNEQAGQLLVDNPAQNDEYLLDSGLPLNDQRVPFRVTVPYGTQSVEYLVDGVSAGSSGEAPFTFLWPPVSGTHTLKAVATLSDGTSVQSSEIKFIVHGIIYPKKLKAGDDVKAGILLL